MGSAYFLALQSKDLDPEMLPFLQDRWLLIALNYLTTKGHVSTEQLRKLDGLLDAGMKVYLDSGCFSLAAEHSKELGCSPPEVFMSSPRDLPFFESWYQVYITVIPRIIDRLWGVVEIDFGNAAERAETRQRIFDDTGVHAIPAFRFGKEPVSVFERLVATHDRVCLAGLAKASPVVRNTALAYLREIQYRVNKDCWVHCLGVSGCGPFSSSGFASGDSSSYANAARYGATNGYTHQGYTSVAEWTKRPPKAKDLDDGTGTQTCRKLGMFQHTVMNVGRTAYLHELHDTIR